MGSATEIRPGRTGPLTRTARSTDPLARIRLILVVMSAQGTSRGRKGGLRDWLTPTRITVGVLTILALVFIFENTREVKIRLLIPEVTMPLYLALLAMFVIGALFGGYFFRRRAR